MFCKHQWKVLYSTQTESTSEQSIRLVGSAPIAHNRFDVYSLFNKKYIVICTCNKCGKIKKYQTNSQDSN